MEVRRASSSALAWRAMLSPWTRVMPPSSLAEASSRSVAPRISTVMPRNVSIISLKARPRFWISSSPWTGTATVRSRSAETRRAPPARASMGRSTWSRKPANMYQTPRIASETKPTSTRLKTVFRRCPVSAAVVVGRTSLRAWAIFSSKAAASPATVVTASLPTLPSARSACAWRSSGEGPAGAASASPAGGGGGAAFAGTGFPFLGRALGAGFTAGLAPPTAGDGMDMAASLTALSAASVPCAYSESAWGRSLAAGEIRAARCTASCSLALASAYRCSSVSRPSARLIADAP